MSPTDHKTTNTLNVSTLNISTWLHHQGEHVGEAWFGVWIVFHFIWTLFVSYSEEKLEIYTEIQCSFPQTMAIRRFFKASLLVLGHQHTKTDHSRQSMWFSDKHCLQIDYIRPFLDRFLAKMTYVRVTRKGNFQNMNILFSPKCFLRHGFESCMTIWKTLRLIFY